MTTMRRSDDPDDLLQRSVEREEGRQLPGRDHLRIDRADGRLHRRRRETGEQPEGHVARHGQLEQRKCGNGGGAHDQRQGEHAAHAPATHPTTRDRPRDSLPDGGRGQDEPGGAVRTGDVLDMEENGQARHAVGEACGELRGHDARDPVGA
jgi:hypothetical protein